MGGILVYIWGLFLFTAIDKKDTPFHDLPQKPNQIRPFRARFPG